MSANATHKINPAIFELILKSISFAPIICELTSLVDNRGDKHEHPENRDPLRFPLMRRLVSVAVQRNSRRVDVLTT